MWWWKCLVPVPWVRTLWEPQRRRNSSLRVESSPTRSWRLLLCGASPAAVRRLATGMAGGALADRVVGALCVGALPCRSTQVGHGHVGGQVPVGVEPVGGAVEEGEPGEVRDAVGGVVEVGVKRPAQVVGGQQVRPVVADNHRRGGD